MELPFFNVYVWDNDSPTRIKLVAQSAGAEPSSVSDTSQVLEFVSAQSERDVITLRVKGRNPGTAKIVINVGAIFHYEQNGVDYSWRDGFDSKPLELKVIP